MTHVENKSFVSPFDWKRIRTTPHQDNPRHIQVYYFVLMRGFTGWYGNYNDFFNVTTIICIAFIVYMKLDPQPWVKDF